jgi:hypothetical protein
VGILKEIVVVSRANGVKSILVDDADFQSVAAVGPWSVCKIGRGFYARTGGAKKAVPRGQYLHHFLMGKHRIDHINGDGLDNRRENLRPVTQAQNHQNLRLYSNNTSGVRGVVKSRGKWRAELMLDGKTYLFGRYETVAEAAAVIRAARARMMPFSNEARY